MSSNAAFSLLELLIGLAMLGIVLASALSTSKLARTPNLKVSARSIAQLINHELLSANRLREKRRLHFESVSGEIHDDLEKTLLRLPASVSMISARFARGVPIAEFRANGTVSPGSVSLKDISGRQCRISVSLRGALRSTCE